MDSPSGGQPPLPGVGLGCPTEVGNLVGSVGTEDKYELEKGTHLAIRKCHQDGDTSPTSLYTCSYRFPLSVELAA